MAAVSETVSEEEIPGALLHDRSSPSIGEGSEPSMIIHDSESHELLQGEKTEVTLDDLSPAPVDVAESGQLKLVMEEEESAAEKEEFEIAEQTEEVAVDDHILLEIASTPADIKEHKPTGTDVDLEGVAQTPPVSCSRQEL